MLRQMWSALTGRNRRLLDLAEIEANCTILASTFAGRQMQGHQGRTGGLPRFHLCGETDRIAQPDSRHCHFGSPLRL